MSALGGSLLIVSLQPLRLVNTARADVLEGGLSDNHFAAQLDKIVRAPEDYPLYGNPDEFFALTTRLEVLQIAVEWLRVHMDLGDTPPPDYYSKEDYDNIFNT